MGNATHWDRRLAQAYEQPNYASAQKAMVAHRMATKGLI
jgi:hypothetical protein